MPKRARPDSVLDQPASSAKRQKHVHENAKIESPLPKYLTTRLKAAARRTPRFLFRAWRYGADSRCISTATSVEPGLVIQDPQLPMYQLSKGTLAKICGALDFSDWTLSLHDALEEVKGLMPEAMEETSEAYLSIIDTTQLPPFVTILHTSDLALLEKQVAKLPQVQDKFLAYGTIQGNWYKAVHIEPILERNKLQWLCGSASELLGPLKEFKVAQRFANCFGENFSLPMLAAMLAGYKHNGDVLIDNDRLEGLKLMMDDYDVPADWMLDPKIKSSKNIRHAGFNSVKRTQLLLRELMEQRYGTKTVREAWAPTLTRALVRRRSILDDSGDEDISMDDLEEEPSDDADVSPDPSDDEQLPSLPDERMDPETKAAVIKATKRTPRYLFRCWSAHSGGRSELTTVKAITPLAFFRGTQKGPTIFHMTRAELTEMAHKHLGTCREAFETEFSSWGASLATAYRFASGPRDCFVSILDTAMLNEDLSKPVNIIMHVPSMTMAGQTGRYRHEYLAHGVISGDAHFAVPLQHFHNARLTLYANMGGTLPPGAPTRITGVAVAKARKVAELYPPHLVVPMTVAILCLPNRQFVEWRSGAIAELDVVCKGLRGFEVPSELCADASILTDIVYTEGFQELEQMIRLLRALVNRKYGRGARLRK